ncbi:hypothetical protein [Neobacillus drentensis]|uniref:hypothetical protein n=1 Tax=Neobacillus drentensis TaxID=220684 RepID=UPI003001EBF4
MSLTLDSRLLLEPVDIHKDKKNYIVEDKATGEFYEMTEVCIDAINKMNNGVPLGQIENHLKEKYPKEVVDLIDFANQLLELNLIDQIDGIKVEKQHREKVELGFLRISPKLGKFFFNRFTYPFYMILFVVILILFIKNPSLFPQRDDIFVFDIMVYNVILWLAFSFFLVLIHEFGHVLAMRAQNLPTKVEVSHRLFFVVLETDMSPVWKLAPKDRNILFLAGLCFDMVILFFSLIYLLMFPNGPRLANALMSLAVFDIVMRVIFQCCIYMKTDLYFVFENLSGCYNLMENAIQSIRKRLSILKVRLQGEVIFASERTTIIIYSIFYMLGIAATIAVYSIYYIPEVIYAGNHLLPGFTQSPTNLAFWDALVFSLQVSIYLLLLLYSWRKKYNHHKLRNEM